MCRKDTCHQLNNRFSLLSLIYHVLWILIPDKNYTVLGSCLQRERILKQKCLLYLFGIGWFGGLVSGRLPERGVQRRPGARGWTQGTTGHAGRLAGAVTQLVEAALKPAVTSTAVLRGVYNSEHHRLPSLSLQVKEGQQTDILILYETNPFT